MMARRKRSGTDLINITEAAALFRLHRWQIRDTARKYHLAPVNNPTHADKRCKWFPKDRLATIIQAEYRFPVAA
jgi:hypothetical protein